MDKQLTQSMKMVRRCSFLRRIDGDPKKLQSVKDTGHCSIRYQRSTIVQQATRKSRTVLVHHSIDSNVNSQAIESNYKKGIVRPLGATPSWPRNPVPQQHIVV
jgi:hypothetical protein